MNYFPVNYLIVLFLVIHYTLVGLTIHNTSKKYGEIPIGYLIFLLIPGLASFLSTFTAFLIWLINSLVIIIGFFLQLISYVPQGIEFFNRKLLNSVKNTKTINL